METLFIYRSYFLKDFFFLSSICTCSISKIEMAPDVVIYSWLDVMSGLLSNGSGRNILLPLEYV